jgi:hypothetical protein
MRLLPLFLAVTLAASGCSLAGRSFGRYIDDKAIAGGVKLRLIADRVPALSRVTVDVFEGTVYLSGSVDAPEQKSDAEIAAWKMEGVEQVVNDLRVIRDSMPSAAVASQARSPLLEHLPGVARIDPPPPGDPRGPSLVYDAAGRLVATVYTVPLQRLGQRGFNDWRASSRPIDHVSIYPVGAQADVPEAQCHLVLWHVSQTEAALLE